MKLRDYQIQAVEGCFRDWQSKPSTMIVIPTGGGKTVIFSHIAKRVMEETGKDVMVFAHREELIYQAKNKLELITGHRAGIEMGDDRIDTGSIFGYPRIIVSTVQSLSSGKRLHKFDPNRFGLLVVDETHHVLARTYRKVVDHFKQNADLKILGVTATPERTDKLAMGTIFDNVAINYGIQEAVKDGWLVRPKQLYVSVEGIDLTQVRTTAGDLNQGDLAQVMEQDRVVRGVVDAINQACGDKKTLIFASSVLQADQMCNLSNMFKPGSSAFICGHTPKEERHRIHAAYKSGQIRRLFNCGVLTEGFDDPDIEVVAIARLTKSLALYKQMLGRGLRPIEDIATLLGDLSSDERTAMILSSRKPTCEILDFCGNSGNHKLVTLMDVLGGKYPDAIREKVLKKAKKAGKVIDVERELEEQLAEDMRKLEEVRKRERERHEKIVSQTKYSTTEIDPFDVFGMFHTGNTIHNEAITEKQRIFLEKSGVPCDKMNRKDAIRMIGEIFKRREQGLPSFKQQRMLQRWGYKDTPAGWKQIIDQRLGSR